MFDPSGLGKDLIEFFLSDGADGAILIEQERSGTGSALIEGKNVFHDASTDSFAPSGLSRDFRRLPTACAVGCILSPLRGCVQGRRSRPVRSQSQGTGGRG